jgi:adenine-specific DNA-methyltransferase
MNKSKQLPMQTVNLSNEKFSAFAALFPNAVTESVDENGVITRAIDADVLRQEINARVVEGKEERYQFTWPDKKKSMLLANAPIDATLRPCREESENFDDTENLYIEGDNLDVLKLLRETYLNRVKMIYIDPPYNTGSDFVYNDDFAEDAGEFLSRDGQYDDEGNRLVKNLDSNGRFHTDWLNMIYPRLRLAKDLLRDDGSLFISIDDNEIENLKKICNEIFGEINFVAQVIVQTNPRGRTFDKFIAKTHEYILIYVKNINVDGLYNIHKSEHAIAEYQKKDNNGKYRLLELRNRNPVFNRINRPLMFYPLFANPDTLEVSLLPTEKHTVEIYPRNSQGEDGCWTWGLEKATAEIGLLVANHANTGKWSIFRKDYLEGTSLFTKSKALWLEKEMNHENGKETVGDLFGKTPFDFPKSVSYISKCLQIATSSGGQDIILDFFSGSATTAHAVMQLNAEDGGKRKFIMVQIPEPCAADSEAAKAGYANICEIGKERIRRAGSKIKADNADKEGIDSLDTGFRVLKLASSNMKDVYYTPDEQVKQWCNLDGLVDNIKKDRTAEDLLFQVMLDLGVPLSEKITRREIGGKTVFSVGNNNLAACFESVTDKIVTQIAQSKPCYAVFRDSGFAGDSTMANFEQIFATYSPTTVRKVL